VPPEPLLEVEISADYPKRANVLRDVGFQMWPGEILGLIGRSGSGKSTIALAVPRLLELRGGRVRGRIRFLGQDLMAASGKQLRRLWGSEIALVFQSPHAALNPSLCLETQLREVWKAHCRDSWSKGRQRASELLQRMELPTDRAFLRRYPRQLSVGQAQRVVITMAVLHRPKLLIADEPTSALDQASSADILELFRGLNRDFGTAILYISHDLSSVRSLCRRVAVISEGNMVASGSVEEILASVRGESQKDLLPDHSPAATSLQLWEHQQSRDNLCPSRALL